eukprot:JP448115.1.p3 GENE.JP448115.1~~JP448115.1.p3  ORF type:complete len:68 (+),score=7.27 JP448115.1:30-206(+)
MHNSSVNVVNPIMGRTFPTQVTRNPVHQGPNSNTCTRMDNQASRLVHDQHIVVLVNNV